MGLVERAAYFEYVRDVTNVGIVQLPGYTDFVQVFWLVRLELLSLYVDFLLFDETQIELHLFPQLGVLFLENLDSVHILHRLVLGLVQLIFSQLHLFLHVLLEAAFVEHMNATLSLISAVAEAIQGLEVSALISRLVEVA